MPNEPDLTEIDALIIDEVHGVTTPANGFRFIFMKGIEDPDDEDASPEALDSFLKSLDEYDETNGPIAEAAYDAFVKADFTEDERKKLASKGEAMADGSYPIPNVAYLKKAIRAVGRGKNHSHDAIRRFIIKRAKALGATGALPETWNVAKEGDMPEPAPNEATGDPDATPGDSAWESKDTAMAICVGQMLADTIRDLGCLINRETDEVEAGVEAPDDAVTYNLQDAIYSLECALKAVALFAFTEEAEARAAMEPVEKSAQGNILDQTRSTIEVLERLASEISNPGSKLAAVEKEGNDMPLSEEDLAAISGLVSKSVAEAVAALPVVAGAAEVKPSQEEIDAATLVLKAAGVEIPAAVVPKPENAVVPKAGDAAVEGLPAELTEVMKSTFAPIADALAGLDARLTAFEGAPASGGIATSQHNPGDGGPRDANVIKSAFETKRAEILRLEGSGDESLVAKAGQVRQDLGRDILREVFAQRGYDDSPSRSQRRTNFAPAV
jgi:hypothetical protein